MFQLCYQLTNKLHCLYGYLRGQRYLSEGALEVWEQQLEHAVHGEWDESEDSEAAIDSLLSKDTF